MNNYILEYYQGIQSGEITVGWEIRTWYAMLVHKIEAGEYRYSAKKAKAAIVYIENFCRHHQGPLAPQKLKLELWEKAMLSVVFGIVDPEGNRQFREVLIVISRKNGKAVSLDTEIATPNGWVKMGKIQEGDLVFGQDGRPSKVVYCSPIFDKPMYRVTFEDGATVKASADHLWTVQTKGSRRTNRYKLTGAHLWAVNKKFHANGGWYEMSTEEMAGDYMQIRKDGKGAEYKYRVPMAEPVEYPEKELPLDPYTLGVWLGDGSKGTTTITCAKDDVAETTKNIEAEGHKVKVRYPKNRAALIDIDVTERGKPNPMRDKLRALGVFNEKKIPEQYMFASAGQRLALLQGLMDTDGFCSKAGQCEFSQKEEKIADQVRELLASLGIKSSKTKKTITCNGKSCYAFSVKFYTDKKRPCFRMSRKAERLKEELAPRMRAKSVVKIERIPNEPSRCIMIDNASHLYLVGRQYTATHNTLLAAAIASYCLFVDGEYGAEICFTAPKLDQARLCFDAFYQMTLKEPQLAKLVTKRRTDVYYRDVNSVAKPIAFSAKKSDGLNVSLGVCDELASWQGDQGIKFYEVIKSSMGARRQPLLLSITTAGYVNDGAYDELMKRSTAVLKGTSKETRLAPFIYKIDDVAKWDDLNELQKSNPNLGVSVSYDYMLEEINIAQGSLAKKAEFLTKYCNVKQNSSQAWLDSLQIEKCFSGEPLRLEDFRKCYCVGGIDLSRSGDLTACTAVIEREQKLYVFAKFFLPAAVIQDATARDGIPYEIYIQKGLLTVSGENYIDYHDCYQWFVELIEKYRIYPLVVGYDRNMARYLVQDMEAYGFQMDDVYQGENLTPVINEVEGMIRDQTLECGDNDLLKIHFYNSAIKENAENNKKRLVKLATAQHIDGMAAFLDAMTVRQKWHDEIGHRLKNKG